MARTTKNPRIAFVPSDQVLRLVRQLSELNGQSMASIVSEMMDVISPVVQGQIDALLKVAATPEMAREIVEGYFDECVDQLAQAKLDFEAEADGRSVQTKAAKNPLKKRLREAAARGAA